MITFANHRISEICQNAVESMVDDLDFFWPGFSKTQTNFMSERNLSLHLAREFRNRGFHIYAEVSFDSRRGTANKVDLLVLSPAVADRVDVLVIEAKRMWRSSEYRKLEHDMKKINAFYRYFEGRVGRQRGIKGADFPYRLGKKFGLIANLSWDSLDEGAKGSITNTQWNAEKINALAASSKMPGRDYGFPLTGHHKKLVHYDSIFSHALFYEFEIPKT